MKRRKWVGLGIGGVFTVAVGALIVAFNLASVKVDKKFERPKGIYVDTTSFPARHREALKEAVDRLGKEGITFVLAEGPADSCTWDGVDIPCRAGWGTLAGEVVAIPEGHLASTANGTTAILPPFFEDSTRGEDIGPDGEMIDVPVYDGACVIAHEILHLLGASHAYVNVGGLPSSPSGHVLNPDLAKCGWNMRGLDWLKQ